PALRPHPGTTSAGRRTARHRRRVVEPVPGRGGLDRPDVPAAFPAPPACPAPPVCPARAPPRAVPSGRGRQLAGVGTAVLSRARSAVVTVARMPELSVLAWLLLAIAALFVGLSKTALPGSNTISVAIFAALLPAKQSTGALLVLLIVGDAFAVWSYRRHASWPVLRRLVPTVLAGLVLGALFLAVASDAEVRRVIGVILLAV